jgi:hypothetical protein
MSRTAEERVAAVRRLLSAANEVYAQRRLLIPAIVASTGLSPEGVELGFSCLERDATEQALGALVVAAGDTPRVHVILSANVFVAPLRALAVARAAADTVTVRASPRDPTLARALVDAAADPALSLIGDRDRGLPAFGEGQIHVYGRDETIAAVRRGAVPGVVVRGHGAGLGVALVSRAADLDAAAQGLARDVVLFDQRGCMSPRVAFVEGGAPQGEAFATRLHERLAAWAVQVPRGTLSDAERAESRRWRDAFAFSGRILEGEAHAVSVAPGVGPLTIGPPGRHVSIVPVDRLEDVARPLAPIARFVVAAGTDDPVRARSAAPSHARLAELGSMHSVPLDGPVDLRDH